MGVLGQANNSHISGVLVLRGQDHKAVVEVAPDWESYEYKMLDIYGREEVLWLGACPSMARPGRMART